jgi:hypothetical protein
MYHTTGLRKDQIVELCAKIHAEFPRGLKAPWPPVLGLYTSVVVTLTYLRRNRVQAEIGEAFGVSQPTISRAICAVTPLLEKVLSAHVPTAEDLHPGVSYLVDGTLLPCWSWADHPALYSGKHKTTGMNVQVAATLDGRLAWISDALPGSTHDLTALRTSGVFDEHGALDAGLWVADKGYIGNNMITPVRKTPSREFTHSEISLNTGVNRIRYTIEQVIAHFKNWRIMHTDYRRPLHTFTATISTIIALHFYTLSCA